MLTRKRANEQRRALKRDIERAHKKKSREELGELRKKLKTLYAAKRARMSELAERCRAERQALRDRLRETRARVLRELRDTAAVERLTARELCERRIGESRASCSTAVGQAEAALRAERDYQADLRRLEKGNRARRAASNQATSRKRTRESDDEVRQNISPDLVPLFDKVRRSIRGSPLISRTEALLLYAEEHPHEVFEVVEAKTERTIRELEQRRADAAKSAKARRPVLPPNVPKRRYSAAELASVPF